MIYFKSLRLLVFLSIPFSTSTFAQTPATFEGQTDTNKRYRWLAQTHHLGGTVGKDCGKRTIEMPLVSFEDAGVPFHKDINQQNTLTHYPPKVQAAMNDTQKTSMAGNDYRLFALRHGFPKLTGSVYGFDAQGKRTGEMLLNADVINMSIHGQNSCVQQAYSSSDQAKEALNELTRFNRYGNAVQALFQKDTYVIKGANRLNKTVVFSNDPHDQPFISAPQAASADIAAKLNARLKAKLARDLAQERQSIQKGIDTWKTYTRKDKEIELIQFTQGIIEGKPTPAQLADYHAQRLRSWEYELDKLPTNIDAIFTPCPVKQYPLNPQASRMVYQLLCSKTWFGFYEKNSNDELVLIKTQDTRSAAQIKQGQEPSKFSKGFANFDHRAWTEPYIYHWRQQWIDGQGKRRVSPYSEAPVYTKGIASTNDNDFHYVLHGVYDLLPMSPVILAQIYMSSSDAHEEPLQLNGFTPGEKPGDAWIQRPQTWPNRLTE